MSDFNAVLLDAHDTIWGMAKTPAEVWQEVLSSVGVDMPLARLEEAVGKVAGASTPEYLALETSGPRARPEEGVRALVTLWQRQVLAELGLEIADGLYDAVSEGFDGAARLFPDTLPVLEELHGSYRLAIVSNGLNQVRTCHHLGIDRYFDEIIGSLHVGVRKPMPEIFHLALSALDVRPQEAVMVGDTWEADVVGAEAVGIKALHFVRDGRQSASPDAIRDLWGLVRFLERLPGREGSAPLSPGPLGRRYSRSANHSASG